MCTRDCVGTIYLYLSRETKSREVLLQRERLAKSFWWRHACTRNTRNTADTTPSTSLHASSVYYYYICVLVLLYMCGAAAARASC